MHTNATNPTQPDSPARVQALTPVERFFNRAVGFLASHGWTPADYVELQVTGRRTGKLYTTPVNPLEVDGRRYLVAPRGETQWVKNAVASGEVTLRHGRDTRRYRVRQVPVAERAPLLSDYLTRYTSTVQRFFSVEAGAELAAFEAIAADHPVFELLAD